MVAKEILTILSKIEDIKEKKKFLLKEFKKTQSKDEKLEIRRLIDELTKKEDHVPIEGQDLSQAVFSRGVNVEEAPKYERLQVRNVRGFSELERTVSEQNTREREENQVVYRTSSQSQPIDQSVTPYEGVVNTQQQLVSGLERKWAEKGIDRRSIDSDPSIRDAARQITSQYLGSTPEDVERYLSRDQSLNNNPNNFYEPRQVLRETNVRENIELEKRKKQKEQDIEKYFIRPKGDSF